MSDLAKHVSIFEIQRFYVKQKGSQVISDRVKGSNGAIKYIVFTAIILKIVGFPTLGRKSHFLHTITVPSQLNFLVSKSFRLGFSRINNVGFCYIKSW